MILKYYEKFHLHSQSGYFSRNEFKRLMSYRFLWIFISFDVNLYFIHQIVHFLRWFTGIDFVFFVNISYFYWVCLNCLFSFSEMKDLMLFNSKVINLFLKMFDIRVWNRFYALIIFKCTLIAFKFAIEHAYFY
jgi:hypothetical protein